MHVEQRARKTAYRSDDVLRGPIDKEIPLAWPYFRMSVAQRRMSWPFDMLATFLQNLRSTSAFLPGAWNDNSSDVRETGRSRNVLLFFSDLLLVILARST